MIEEYNKQPIIIEEEKIPDIIGKPFSDPFEVFAFKKSDKILKIQKYEKDLIEEKELNNYGSSSAYCNGNNNLYISGGEKKDYEDVNTFWKINLISQEIEKIQMIPKKKHSMIYIPGGFVVIVGGNDKKTFYYDEQNNKFFSLSDLNKNRIEPALILISEYLYCFDNINSKENNEELTFEKINLGKENSKWEILNPILAPSIANNKMNQKFFGVVKNDDDNILFLGGNVDDEGENEENLYNYKYNIQENSIEPSDIPFREYNFKEKKFLPYNQNVDYILPDFNRFHPEVIFYQKNKKKLNLVKYEPNHGVKEHNIRRPLQEIKYNFNMPSVSLPKNEIINDINIGKEEEFNIEIDKPKIDINNNSFDNDSINKKYEQPPPFKEPEINPNMEDNKISINIPNSIIDGTTKNLNINKIKLEQNDIMNENNIKLNGSNNSIDLKKYNDLKLNGELNVNVNNSGIKTNFPNINYQPIDASLNNKIIGNIDSGVNINNPINNNDIDIKNPNFEVNANSQNFNINTPSININDIKININNDNNKNIVINEPNFTTKVPEVNVEGPKFEINGPKLDFKTSNIKENSSNYIDGFIQGKTDDGKIDMNNNINLKSKINNVNIKGELPGINIKEPKMDINGNLPNINSFNPKIEGPKVDYNLKGNLKAKDFFLQGTIPGINSKENLHSTKININGPKINSPDIKIKGNAPDINISTSKIDLKKEFNISGVIPGKKLNNINFKGPNAKMDFNLKESKGNSPSLKVNTPKIENDFNINKNLYINGSLPSMEFKEPKIDIKKPEIDASKDINIDPPKIELPSGNININGPNINNDFDLNGNLYGTDIAKIDYKAPGSNIKMPEIDINPPNIDMKAKKGDIKFEGNVPGINAKAPKMDLEVPNINANIKGQNTELSGIIPGINAKAPKIDLKGPNINANIKGQNTEFSGIIPGNKAKAPKIDVKGPTINTNIKGPNSEFSGIIPGIKAKAPKIDVNGTNSNINIKGKNYNLSGIIPGTGIKETGDNLHSGNIKIKGPEIKSNINGNIPKLNFKNIEGTNVDFNVKGDKINIPDSKLNGNIGGNVEFKGKNPNLNGKINSQNINIKGPSVNVKESNISSSGFFLSGLIPPKLNKNPQRKIKTNIPEIEISGKGPNINTNHDFNMSGNKNKMNFHGNLNDNTYFDYGADIKGQRRAKFTNMDNDFELNTKLNRKNINIEQSGQSGNILQDVNSYINNYKIKNENNNEIKVDMPKIEIKNDYKLDNNDSKNMGIDSGHFGGNINLKSKPVEFGFNTNEEYKIGMDVNFDGVNKNDDINLDNLGKNFIQDDGNNDRILLSSQGGGIKKKNKGLPLVGSKNDIFISSRIDKAGNFDTNNINIDNMKSASVGINGQKIGDRIVN